MTFGQTLVTSNITDISHQSIAKLMTVSAGDNQMKAINYPIHYYFLSIGGVSISVISVILLAILSWVRLRELSVIMAEQ